MIHTASYDGSLNFDTKIDTTGFTRGTNSIKAQASGLKRILGGFGKMMIAAFSITALVKFGKQAVNIASDLQEVQNVVDTAFGDMSYKMEEFAEKSIESFGISKLAAKQTGSTFMAMARGMGIAIDGASDMAISLTGLSADMASFYNVSQDVASTALESIFTGETETLKQFGVVMTEANLQAYAMSQGIKKNVSDMTQAEKVQLRYAFVMNQTALAQGDFAKTSGSWANQTRVLSEKWKEFLGILGTGLIQVLTPVVKFLSASLSYLITFANTVGKVLSSVFNLNSATGSTAKNTAAIGVGAEDASSGLDEMGKSAKKASKAAGNTAGFDKLNNQVENIADKSSGAADAISGIGSVGGGTYGATVKVNSDTSPLETGLTAAMENAKILLSGFNTWITTNFVPIFAGIWTNLQGPIADFKGILSGMFSDIQTLGQPLLDYFNGPYTEYLRQAFTTIGNIAVGLFDTFNMVFSDIWNIAVFPVAQKFITDILPMLTEFGTQAWSLLEVVFTEVKKIFDMIWKDAIAPALKLATKIWTDFVDILVDFWNKWGKPIFDNLKLAWQTTSDLFQTLWKTTLKPIWDTFMKTVDKLWTEHLKPLVANFMDFVGEFVNGALEIYNKFIAPVVKWFIEKFGPPISKVISGLITFIGNFLGGIIDAVSGIITALKGIVQFITGVFTGDWKKAWTGVKNIFKGVFDALVNIVRSPINLIIDIINGMISGIVAGINAVINAVNKLSFEIPATPFSDAVKIGFNLKTVTAPKIPRLATGTVVPKNYGEFLSILGDNKREAEVVSPLSTMKQAFKEAMGEMGSNESGGMMHVTITLPNGKVLFDTVVEAEKENYNATGNAAFAH